MNHNGFTGIYLNQLTTQNGFLKFDSNRLTTLKASRIFWLNQLMTKKNFPGFWFRSTHDSKNLEYWFEWSHDTMIRINCRFRWPFLCFHSILLASFGLSLNFVDLFGAFTKFRCSLLGIQLGALIRISSWLKQYHENLSRFNSWLQRLSRNCLRINSWLKWIPHVMIQINSWLKIFPIFRFKSTHGSSEKHLILSRFMIRPWVIPMSVGRSLSWSKGTLYCSKRTICMP